MSFPHPNVLTLQLRAAQPPGGDTSSVPSQCGVESCSCRRAWQEGSGRCGDGGRGPRPGELGPSQCVVRLAGQPASQPEPGTGRTATPGGSGWGLWVQAPLGLAGGPSPTASKQSNDSRIELWELQSQVPLVGMTAGRSGWGPPGRGRPCLARTWAEAVPIDD